KKETETRERESEAVREKEREPTAAREGAASLLAACGVAHGGGGFGGAGGVR
ncbi:hypothetical protein A2U01_0104217, partial [Trifolium medium]|nr:hypothetical protein [Trifolium medium]